MTFSTKFYVIKFQTTVNTILKKLMTDVGAIPGNCVANQTVSLFQSLITPKLKQYLSINGLQKEHNISENILKFNECSDVTKCRSLFRQGMIFRNQINLIFPRRTTRKSFLQERPDFHLGVNSTNVLRIVFFVSKNILELCL